MSKIEYKELLAFHPGYYVKDYIDDQQISQDELAKRLQVSSKYVSDLVNGRIALTDDMVLKLLVNDISNIRKASTRGRRKLR